MRLRSNDFALRENFMQLVLRNGVAKSLLMGLLGAVAAYVTLALASTAAVFTPLCAFVGGLVGSLIAGRARWLATIVLCGLIAIETSYLYSTQRVDGPLWFEAGAAAALILAACAATWLYEYLAVRRDQHPPRA
jgi:hypothetical protein